MVRVLLLCCVAAFVGCNNCGEPVNGDKDGGVEGEGDTGEGEGEGDEGEGEPTDGGPNCTEETEHFGEPCSTDDIPDPPCGTMRCAPLTDSLACQGPPRNACGGCNDLDQAAGHVGDSCGTFGCGVVGCADDGTKTECKDPEAPQNICGGCIPLSPTNAVVGEQCSTCLTGTRTCGEDQESLFCVRGREPDNQCGGCERCVLYHAFMVDVAPGGYLLPGTVALVEDVGGASPRLRVSFDPLIEGPGCEGLPSANVYFSVSEDPFDGTGALLLPAFASSSLDPRVRADPARNYVVTANIQPSFFSYLVIADNAGLLSNPVIAVGELIPGPPPASEGEGEGEGEGE